MNLLVEEAIRNTVKRIENAGVVPCSPGKSALVKAIMYRAHEKINPHFPPFTKKSLTEIDISNAFDEVLTELLTGDVKVNLTHLLTGDKDENLS